MGEQKKGGLLKWILMGCGCISILGVLGVGGCGLLIYFAGKAMFEKPTQIAKAYVMAEPSVKAEFGEITKAEFNLMAGSNVHIANGAGKARICLDVVSAKGSGSAVVWLSAVGDDWKAVGCSVTIAGKTVKAGEEVVVPEAKSSSSD